MACSDMANGSPARRPRRARRRAPGWHQLVGGQQLGEPTGRLRGVPGVDAGGQSPSREVPAHVVVTVDAGGARRVDAGAHTTARVEAPPVARPRSPRPGPSLPDGRHHPWPSTCGKEMKAVMGLSPASSKSARTRLASGRRRWSSGCAAPSSPGPIGRGRATRRAMKVVARLRWSRLAPGAAGRPGRVRRRTRGPSRVASGVDGAVGPPPGGCSGPARNRSMSVVLKAAMSFRSGR